MKLVSNVMFSNVDKHTIEGEQPVLLCNYVDVYHNDFITDEIEFMRATATETEIERFTLREGDVLITKDSETWDAIAVPAYITKSFDDVLCGYHLSQIRPNHRKILGKYLFWAFNSLEVNDQYKVAATGVTRYGLGKYALENSFLPLPLAPEQRAIADFLDRKTAQIDELIAKKQRQIKLLQEYRTALINQAVTKGLNPIAPMKDSGIEWLGQVPYHWNLGKLKHFTRFTGGYSYPSREWQEAGLPVIRMSNFSPTGELNITEKNIKYISQSFAEKTQSFKLNKGDLLIAMTDMSSKMGILGKTIIFNKTGEYYLNQRVGRMKVDTAQMDLNFFHFVTNSDSVRNQIKSNVYPNVQYNASTESIKNSHLTSPPIQEQWQIVEFLIAKTQGIDIAVEKAGKEIELWQEYRTALISAAVTGKIDVRKGKNEMSPYYGAILIIGSLLWDEDEIRTNWRNSDLDITQSKIVYAPIRYGRISGGRRKNTFTMVFSSLCYPSELGTAVLVPLKEPISNKDELLANAANLWQAERPISQIYNREISYKWGSVGLLVNPDGSFSNELIENWKHHYESQDFKPEIRLAANEIPIITPEGILEMQWPCEVGNGNFVALDFILATAIKPKPNDGRYPAGQEIAQACIENEYTEYFDRNRECGITTFQDGDIENHIGNR